MGFSSAEEVLATPLTELMKRFELFSEDGKPFPLEKLPGRIALAGQEGPRTVVRFRIVATGEERWSITRATPVFDADGVVRFAVNVFHDVTAEKQAEFGLREARRDADEARRKMTFLAEASHVLAASIDYRDTLSQIARLAVPAVADWCSIDIVEGAELKNVAVSHVDPSKVELAERMQERYPPRLEEAKVIQTGKSELYPEITPEMIRSSAKDEDQAGILVGLGLQSAMSVPLIARQRAIGRITFVSDTPDLRYNQEDLAFAEDLGSRAALAIDKAGLFRDLQHERDRYVRMARTLQQSLLPPIFPDIEGLEVAGRYRAAGEGNEVGGDFYDVFSLGEGDWAIAVGDVCGKGPQAAALTGLGRHTIRAASRYEATPSGVLHVLNHAVLGEGLEDRFVTATYARLRMNGTSAGLTVSNGGHPLPLVLRTDGNVERLGPFGTLLGVFEHPWLENQTHNLSAGDTVVFYTDGLTDERGATVEASWLLELLPDLSGKDAVTIADTVVTAAVENFAEEPRDDIAILVARLLPE
jgi:serine phosphatase RsbU (regulator of sigma subunit)